MHGPFSTIPEFTEGIGYGMMFNPCSPHITDKTNQYGELLTQVGTAIVTGPDVHQVTIYQSGSGSYFYE